ncbi:hypothetical protein Trydic_g15522 [Trypoxylus dichotomus]
MVNVFLWHKRFLEDRERLEDDNREGKKISAWTPKIIEKIRDFIENDPNSSLKMMEHDLNISKETIRIIVHEDFSKTKVRAKFIPNTLTAGKKWLRFNHSTEVIAAA